MDSDWVHPDEDDEAFPEVLGFEGGGRVERTGIALVHEGEYITPAPGSGAVVVPSGAAASGHPVSLSFPVEIEVIGELTEAHMQAVAEYVFDQLDAAMQSRA